MTKQGSSLNNAFPLDKLAEASGRGLFISASAAKAGAATKRQKKHEMLLTFMANAQNAKPKRKLALQRPKLVSALFSLFF